MSILDVTNSIILIETNDMMNTPREDGEEKRSPRRKIFTNEDINHQFDNIEKILNDAIEDARREKHQRPEGAHQLGKEVKFIQKIKKEIKELKKGVSQKIHDKPKVKKGNNNSGFMKPAMISQELADFIKVDSSIPISRVAATKLVYEYIKENKLQGTDKRIIIPDAALSKILDVPQNIEDFKYFNLVSKIQKHFTSIKGEVPLRIEAQNIEISTKEASKGKNVKRTSLSSIVTASATTTTQTDNLTMGMEKITVK